MAIGVICLYGIFWIDSAAKGDLLHLEHLETGVMQLC